MKTIATTVVLMMLAVPAWANEPANKQANERATTKEPIVLSEAEMDTISAGQGYTYPTSTSQLRFTFESYRFR